MEAFDAGGVTGIVWRRVVPGGEARVEGIMRELMGLARKCEGYLGSEIFPPIPGVQDAYVVLYRFDSGAHLRGWLGCDRRQELLRQVEGLLAEPAKEFFFAHSRTREGTASSVFAYRIREDKREAFEGWRRRIFAEMQNWEGFLGTESFDAIEGDELEFIVVGIEGAAEGNAHFCGEHTSIDAQGYLEGAVETGERAASEIIAALH